MFTIHKVVKVIATEEGHHHSENFMGCTVLCETNSIHFECLSLCVTPYLFSRCICLFSFICYSDDSDETVFLAGCITVSRIAIGITHCEICVIYNNVQCEMIHIGIL